MDLPDSIKNFLNAILEPYLKIIQPWVVQHPQWVLGIILVCLVSWHNKRLYVICRSLTGWINRTRQSASARGKEKLTILISPLQGDLDYQATQRLATALQENFRDAIDVVTLSKQLKLPTICNINEEIEKLRKKAKKILRKNKGDLLLWGEASKGQLRLYIDQPHSKQLQSNVYHRDCESFNLPENLPKHVGVALSAVMLHWSAPVVDPEQSGFPQAKKLRPLLKKLRVVLQNIPSDFHMFKGDLYHANGLLAYQIGFEQGDSQLIFEAIGAYQKALEEWTRERALFNWAKTQNNLGNALQAFGERQSDKQYLKKAIVAYHEALKEWTRATVPLNWAMVYNNLGTALRALGERETSIQYMEKAITSYREALKERTRPRVPRQWAATQNNLGTALGALGVLSDSTHHLKKAIIAYKEALKEWPPKHAPLNWAMAQSNIGNSLQALNTLEPNKQHLEEAVAAYHEALKERTRERVPFDWAKTQNNLGEALYTLGKRANSMQYLEAAESALKNALAIFEEAGADYYVKNTKQNLEAILQEYLNRTRSSASTFIP